MGPITFNYRSLMSVHLLDLSRHEAATWCQRRANGNAESLASGLNKRKSRPGAPPLSSSMQQSGAHRTPDCAAILDWHGIN
jgi:hypothetical protein